MQKFEGKRVMTENEARSKTIELFGEDSFTEEDDFGGITRFYVGALPREAGAYIGYMGFSWEQVLDLAEVHENLK